MGFLAIAARALTGRRPRPVGSPSPIWPTTTSASSATATPPPRRTFAELVGRGRNAAPPARPPVVTGTAVVTPRPPAVTGAAEGSFGSPVRRFAPVPASPAARPTPGVLHAPRKPPKDFSHLTGNAVPPVDAPRQPEKPNPKYSAQWQKAFAIAIGTERPQPYRTDSKTSALWQKAFRHVLGEQSR
jgi:hypothetical protein